MAVIFEQMRPQVQAILAVDDGAAGGTGVAFIGNDQFQRMAEQFDMLVIDRGDAGDASSHQTYRIVAAANAGLEHREIAIAFLEIETGQCEHGFERAKALVQPRRHPRNPGTDPRREIRQLGVADRRAVDLKPLIEFDRDAAR